MLQVGILGTGFGYEIIGAALLNSQLVKVKSIYDRDAKKAKKAKKHLGAAQYFTDWKQLISDSGCDLICIALPPYMHFEAAEYALQHNKHILVTAPFTLNLEKAEKLSKQIENRELKGAVLHFYNYMPARKYAVRLLKEGKIGNIISVERTCKTDKLRTAVSEHTWRDSKKLGGGLLNQIGAHDTDYLLRILGGIHKVQAEKQTLMLNRKNPNGEVYQCTADDAYTMNIQFHRGATATMRVNAAYPGREVDEFVFYGSEGCLMLTNNKELTYYEPNGQKSRLGIPPNFQMINLPGHTDISPVFMFMETLVSSIYNKSPITPTFSEALHTQRILDAAHLSDENSQWVEIGSVVEKKVPSPSSSTQIDKIYE